MRLDHLSRRLARHASGVVLAAFLVSIAACSGESPEPPPTESASTPTSTPTVAATPSVEADTEYCAELYEFHVAVNTFVAEAYGNMPMAEPLTADQLIAEADRLAQWALDLSAATPPQVAEPLAVVSEALAAASDGFAEGLENWEAMLPASESEIRDERDLIGAAATQGDCA